MGKKRVASIIVSALLAVMLCPVVAYASPLEAATADDASGVDASVLLAQGNAKTVYVLSSVTETRYPTTVDSDGNTSSSFSFTTKYAYNKNGLLKKATTTYPYAPDNTKVATYSYSGNNLKKIVKNQQGTTTFKLSKSGLKTKGTRKQVTENWSNTTTETYKYKSGRVSQSVATSKISSGGTTHTYKESVSYGYDKKGTPIKLTINEDGSKYVTKYAYDKNGNMASITKSWGKTTYKNTYGQNKLLENVVRVDSNNAEFSKIEYAYTYKAISVNESLVDSVEAQRWSLQNQNLNLALGGYSLS